MEFSGNEEYFWPVIERYFKIDDEYYSLILTYYVSIEEQQGTLGLIFDRLYPGPSYAVYEYAVRIGRATDAEIIIPATYEGRRVVEIANSGFYGCPNITKVLIPDSVRKIGDWAFADCDNLKNVSIMRGLDDVGVDNIGNGAFSGCKSLASISLIGISVSDGMIAIIIGDSAFDGCDNLTIYTNYPSLGYLQRWDDRYSRWHPYLWCPIILGCAARYEDSSVVSFTKTTNSIKNLASSDVIKAPYREGYTFGGWAITPSGPKVYEAADINNAPEGTTLYAIWIKQ